MVRELLRIEPKELPLSLLNATWRVIDDDGSGQLTAGEFGKFMRLGMTRVDPKAMAQARLKVTTVGFQALSHSSGASRLRLLLRVPMARPRLAAALKPCGAGSGSRHVLAPRRGSSG